MLVAVPVQLLAHRGAGGVELGEVLAGIGEEQALVIVDFGDAIKERTGVNVGIARIVRKNAEQRRRSIDVVFRIFFFFVIFSSLGSSIFCKSCVETLFKAI